VTLPVLSMQSGGNVGLTAVLQIVPYISTKNSLSIKLNCQCCMINHLLNVETMQLSLEVEAAMQTPGSSALFSLSKQNKIYVKLMLEYDR
jgi:hypothetical protein